MCWFWHHSGSMHSISKLCPLSILWNLLFFTENMINADSFLIDIILQIFDWIILFLIVITAAGAHKVTGAFATFNRLSALNILLQFLIRFDSIFNQLMNWAFLFFLFLLTFFSIFLRMKLSVNFDKIALNFLKLVHDRQVFLEARQFCVICT